MRLALATAILFAALPAMAAGPYAGQEARDIASLSEDDVAALLAGEGWGLAKPAELNGYPGPAHVLELSDDLGLTPDQLERVRKVHAEMKETAQRVGADYVEAERHLSMMFDAGHATEERLRERLAESATILGSLRLVHLRAHLATAEILSPGQRDAYAALRDYAGGGSGGHDAHGGHGQ